MPEIDFFNMVDADFKHSPELEEFIGSNKLKDGMRVLIADSERRVDLSFLMQSRRSEWLMEKANKYNRWCTISNVHFFDRQVAFTATYDDGMILQRVEPIYVTWFVKKNTIPETAEEKKAKVLEAVHNALLQQDSATYHGKSMDGPKAEDVVEHIYKILGL